MISVELLLIIRSIKSQYADDTQLFLNGSENQLRETIIKTIIIIIILIIIIIIIRIMGKRKQCTYSNGYAYTVR